MFEWLKKFFGKKEVAPAPLPEILYCEDDGEKLTVEKEVLKYSPYTGRPMLQKVVKSCPKDHRVVNSVMESA